MEETRLRGRIAQKKCKAQGLAIERVRSVSGVRRRRKIAPRSHPPKTLTACRGGFGSAPFIYRRTLDQSSQRCHVEFSHAKVFDMVHCTKAVQPVAVFWATRAPARSGSRFPFCREMAKKRCHQPPAVDSDGVPLSRTIHATVALLPADPQRDAARGRDRVASPDAARRHDPPTGTGLVQHAAARQAGSRQGLQDHPRRAGPGGRAGDPDADGPVGGIVDRKRPLQRLWHGDAPNRRPP